MGLSVPFTFYISLNKIDDLSVLVVPDSIMV